MARRIWRTFASQAELPAAAGQSTVLVDLGLGGLISDGDTLLRSMIYVHAYTERFLTDPALNNFPSSLMCFFRVAGTAFGTDLVGDAVEAHFPTWVPHYIVTGTDVEITFHADSAAAVTDSKGQRKFVDHTISKLTAQFNQGPEGDSDPTNWAYFDTFVNFYWRYLIEEA